MTKRALQLAPDARDFSPVEGWRNAQDRRVFINGLELQASIGVHPHEHEAHQPVVVSLELAVRPTPPGAKMVFRPPARENDAAADEVVCYESLSLMVQELLNDGHIDYVEELAARIVSRCLEDERITEVVVRIEKPQAIQFARAAGVELRRNRNS